MSQQVTECPPCPQVEAGGRLHLTSGPGDRLGVSFARRTAQYSGRVTDSITGEPIAEAFVTLGARVLQTDAAGRFQISGDGGPLRIRAWGYARRDFPAGPFQGDELDLSLAPFEPKALFLSFYGIGDRTLRGSALRLIRESRLNALVIDIKGDNGKIPYSSAIPLAAEIGAQKPIIVRDMGKLLMDLRGQGIYTIARLVVFKDHRLASARPGLAVKRHDGKTWHDREDHAWTDPFQREVWDYNIALAMEAAHLGFDEIQLDYVRFPDAGGLTFSRPNNSKNRMEAIEGFLGETRRRLVPYNVFLSADIFGYVCWNQNDTAIGQKLEGMAIHLDYLSPMLYPSSFQFGIPGFRHPVEHPYEIVRRSLQHAAKRTGLPGRRFRPWLQAFRDYGFDRRPFQTEEIRAQIRAAEDTHSNGWMLWNSRNTYTSAGLK